MIRKAEKKDGASVVELVMIILKDMELNFLTQYGETITSNVLEKAYLSETFRFGYNRGIVAVIEGDVVGAAFGYLEEEETVIDEALKEIFSELSISMDEQMFVDKEAAPGEWYLDSIAVRSDQRGKGIGGALLDALPNYISGSSRIGLNVDQDNPAAKKLYERHGYKDSGEMTISGHVYDHMIKDI